MVEKSRISYATALCRPAATHHTLKATDEKVEQRRILAHPKRGVFIECQSAHAREQRREVLWRLFKDAPGAVGRDELFVDHEHDGQDVLDRCVGRVVGPQVPLEEGGLLQQGDLWEDEK